MACDDEGSIAVATTRTATNFRKKRIAHRGRTADHTGRDLSSVMMPGPTIFPWHESTIDLWAGVTCRLRPCHESAPLGRSLNLSPSGRGTHTAESGGKPGGQGEKSKNQSTRRIRLLGQDGLMQPMRQDEIEDIGHDVIISGHYPFGRNPRSLSSKAPARPGLWGCLWSDP